MKIYEGMFLVDTKEARKASAAVEEHIRSLVVKCGGDLQVLEKWDERKLAYEIKGTRSGTYYLTYFQGEEDTVSRLYRECELSPKVLRALFLRVKKVPEPKQDASGEPAAEECSGPEEKGTPPPAEGAAPAVETGEGAPAPAAEVSPEAEAAEAPASEAVPREGSEG